MLDEPVKRCPECRHKVRRIMSGGAGVIFKGTGFYETDYRSENYKKRAKEEGAKKSEPPKKSDKSGKDKPKGDGKKKETT